MEIWIFTGLFYLSLAALCAEIANTWWQKVEPRLEFSVQTTVLLSAFVLIVQAFCQEPLRQELIWQRVPLAFLCSMVLLQHYQPRPALGPFAVTMAAVVAAEFILIVVADRASNWLQQHSMVIDAAVVIVVLLTCSALGRQIQRVRKMSSVSVYFMFVQASVLLLYGSQAVQGLVTLNIALAVGYGIGAVLRVTVICFALRKVRFRLAKF